MAYSNSFLSPCWFFPIAQENKYWGKFSFLFLFYYEIVHVWCVYSLESPQRGEYTQHTIILLKIENISINYRHLLPGLAPWLSLVGSNYPSLEQISMVPKMFEPLKFDCTIQRQVSVAVFLCFFVGGFVWGISFCHSSFLISSFFRCLWKATFSCKLSPFEKICIKCQNLFSGKSN